MINLGGLVGGLAGDSLKKGMSGVVGGIAGDAFDQGIGGVVGGLAGELIDEPRNVLGGVVGAAVGNDFMPGGFGKGVSFLNGFMDDLGITEQNQEVMGSKEQVFPRYANPEDGTLNNEEMARVDPTDKLLLDSLRRGEIGDPNSPRIRKAIIDLERKIYNEGRASSMAGDLIAEMPRRIRGGFRPAGVFGSPPPNLDSPFMDERIKRGFVPMTPPLPRGAGGPQLPGFV